MKLTDEMFNELIPNLGITKLGETYLRDLRAKEAPSRRAGHGRGNVTLLYPSSLMGVCLQAESRTCEYPTLVTLHAKDQVIEIWDQPDEIQISYQKEGKTITRGYTADYLVIERSRVVLIECKTEEDLKKLEKEQPWMYKQFEGRWHCSPAEEAARRRGFIHVVRSQADFSPIEFQNLLYLEDYTLESTPDVPEAAAAIITKTVQKQPGILLSVLRLSCPDNCPKADFVDYTNTMIARGTIHIDMAAAPLSTPEEVRVFSSKEQVRAIHFLGKTPAYGAAQLIPTPTMAIGSELRWGERLLKIENIINDEVKFSSPEMPLGSLKFEDLQGLIALGEIAVPEAAGTGLFDRAYAELLSTPPKYLKIANERFRAIAPYVRGAASATEALSSTEDFVWIRSLGALVKRLNDCDEKDALEKFIVGELSSETIRTLKEYSPANHQTLRESLIQDLIRIIRTAPIFTPERFAGITISEKVSHLLEVAGENFKPVNRRLLLDAFRKELAPEPELQRSIRRWIADYQKAERERGYGFLGLIPQYDKCGNRKSHVPRSTATLLNEIFEKDFEDKNNISRAAFYRIFAAKCDELGVEKRSSKTVYKWLKSRISYESELRRIGPRGVYSAKPFSYTVPGLEPKSEFPWQRCHIDHTLLDIEVIIGFEDNEPITSRVWLSVLFDDCTSRVLALVVLLDPPSYRTCMLLLRECFNRWRRLPQIIVVDNGPDFNSIYFETLLASFAITKEQRPPHEPRYGSRIERFFGTTNTLWLHQVQGNTKLMKNVRQVTKGVSPKELAVWPYDEFKEQVEKFAYEIYDQRPGHNNSMSPKQCYDQGREGHGKRPSREINEKTFRFLVLPAPRRETAKVVRGRGVKLFGFYYQCLEIIESNMAGQKLPVRYDPFDISKIYVYCSGAWRECKCRLSQDLRNVSERRLRLASRLFGAQRRNAACSQAEYESQVGAFLVASRDRELELQTIRDSLQTGGTVYGKTSSKLVAFPKSSTSKSSESQSELPPTNSGTPPPAQQPPSSTPSTQDIPDADVDDDYNDEF